MIADDGPRAVLAGSLTFTTAINELSGDGFLTPGDVLAGIDLGPNQTSVGGIPAAARFGADD